ncbi:efflux RND transporter periplasmic adaptor subunit [Pseudoalteromonas obscura]|uniref:Multidrug resistance protein MdtA-like barrel-sandwich hybrid domain-containing protein n=1 Tax=Pseudoalteromonas obscura TaxID=3048491 RepID=A0ABT7EJZ1_9GAMM|nr:hypothetical protein [Pseudoalteromonas sp. P94(2023)]MDK2595362.1 hypothetical protein [Pseudoalteromonas sp. P94(2023)]
MRWNLSAKKNLPIAALAGVVLMLLVVKLTSSTKHSDIEEIGQLAQYQVLAMRAIRPEIVGYGKVTPNIQLNSLAQVSGVITYLHPALKKGEIFKAGTLLIEVDDSDYQLQLAKSEAGLASAEVELAVKRTAIKNNQLDIKLSEHKLRIASDEYRRLKRLFDNSSVSQAELDKAQQNMLAQQQGLQRDLNQKNVLPLEVKALQAQVKKALADVNKARIDIERTKIHLPFTGRIHQVNVERAQLVSKGASLFRASDIKKVLINAQYTYQSFNQFSGFFNRAPSMQTISEQGMASYLKEQGLEAKVEILAQPGVYWEASIERLSDEIDPQSQTVGVVVSISDSYKQIELGEKPPLLAGMRAKVTLSASEQDFVVVPRYFIRDGHALIASDENKLTKVSLRGAIKQSGSFLIDNPELSGAKLITTDLFPAIEGTRLNLTASEQLTDVANRERHQ